MEKIILKCEKCNNPIIIKKDDKIKIKSRIIILKKGKDYSIIKCKKCGHENIISQEIMKSLFVIPIKKS